VYLTPTPGNPFLIISYLGFITVHHLITFPHQKKLLKNSITLHNEEISLLQWCDGFIFAAGGGRVDIIEYKGTIYEDENYPIQAVINYK
jgi:hypothetical protein